MKRFWLCTIVFLALLQHAAAQAPVAAFSSNRQSGCAALTVNFRDESTGSPKYWSWDFGNGEFSNLQNPTISYAQPGTYNVTLTVRNGDGTNATTKNGYITVSASPTANFAASATTICAPGTVQFTDRSVPNNSPITNWLWDFGDGTTSTEQNPRKVYSDAGFYTVSLRITSATGCIANRSVARMIRVTNGVTAGFTNQAAATCRPPFNIQFTNETSGPGTLTYRWTFGNSTSSAVTDPVATYAAAGTYDVTLTATSQYGCSNSITKQVTLGTTPTDFTAPATSCINSLINFTNGSSPVSSIWYFGDGSTSEDINAAHTYTAAGNYNVKLVNTYTGCKDSITKSITIAGPPVVSFSSPLRTGCQAPQAITFNNTSPDAVAWKWNFGDGSSGTGANPTHTYNREGNFDVKLIITTRNGCVDSITQNDFVMIRKPVVRFANAPTGGCAPFTYTPRHAVNAPDGVRSFNWDFGNGTTGTGPTPPNVRYNTPGKYPLTLTVVTNAGCTGTATLQDAIQVGTPVAASFTANPVEACASTSIRFINNTTGTDEWLWDFGDGNTSDEKNPGHRYADIGYYTVRLTSFNQKCPGPSTTVRVHVKPPIASFTTRYDCAQAGRVIVTNNSKVDNTIPLTYQWDFGDPSITNPNNVADPGALVYPGLGPYTIKLTIKNGNCSQTVSRTVQFVSEQADFTISSVSVCVDQPATLTAINSDPANINTYQWFLNTTSVANGPDRSVQVTRPTPGSYRVRLIMIDKNGCAHIKTVNNALLVTGPVTRFRPASRIACANKPVTFIDQTTSALPVVARTFDFGDGQTQTFTAPPYTHTYTDTGSYVVKMTATDNGNCSSTYETVDTIKVTSPTAGFKAEYLTICPGSNLQFTDTSFNATTWRWEFGDGSTATGQNPVHVYRGTDGTAFDVKLTVTDLNGCESSVTQAGYITLKTPKADFDIEDTVTICPPLETKFTFKGQDYESFYWDFGDGGASSLDNPSHFYNTYGTYTATLNVLGIGGCITSRSRTVRVINAAGSTNIAFNPQRGCDNLVVDFNITTPDFTTFTFTYGDGATDNTQSKTLRHKYSVPNNYQPRLTLRDNLGCQSTIGARNTVQILGAEVLFGMDKKKFCDVGEVFFTDYTRPRFDPIQSTIWEFGDGTTSTDKNPSHRYTQPGTYYPTLRSRTAAGCNSEMVDTVRIYRTPSPVINSDPTVCINENLVLQAGLQVADTSIAWKWEPNAATDNIVVKYGASGTYTVRLQASNLLGCSGSTSKDIVVPPLPTITVQEDPIIPVGGSIRLPVTYNGNITTYNWTPNTSLDCNDCPNPVASPKYSTKYFVQVTDDLGCTNSQSVTVQVQCNEKNYFVPNTFSPNNDGHNDYFYPRGKGVTRINSMKIFNRWGELLFEKRNFAANDPAAGWDGKIKGKYANPDVYIYVIEFICENAAIVPFRGNVMLMR